MATLKIHENYPLWIVVLSNLNSILLYGLGFLIMFNMGLIYAFLYLAFTISLEFRIIKKHCINCYYWGKTCGFGKGRISSLLFKKGEASNFCIKDMTWKDMIPDMLISLIPVAIGIFLLITNFQIDILIALMVLIVLTSVGNGYIRGQLTCKYCKQREIGCPADKLFNKD